MNSKNILIFTGIGFELIGIMIVTAYIGRYLDEFYGLKGLAAAGTILIGLAMWLVHVLFLMKKVTARDDDS